ncbi:apolipoprotein N-acyltransferase [Teredinibacter purpureus]|uniref:apolipoprotein N-acyltransferase n=1 Tax=Teredinibacter purpureus TaxID=2731756 RepID=UPI000A42CCCC|nr:apolipoprotein N-acyltransferase [Teredinibacter purpureus]
MPVYSMRPSDTPALHASRTRQWAAHAAALIAGALVPLSLAPYDYWPIAIVGIAIFGFSLQGLNPKHAWLRSLSFGLGLYGCGVSWVYVSIHDFGYTSAALAVLMTFLFVAFLALVFSIPFYIYQRYCALGRLYFLFSFPAIWVLGEWLRSWFLTGFPWLYIGYGHIDTWLSGWAPVLGVYGVSFIVVFSATALCYCVSLFNRRHTRLHAGIAVSLTAALWLAGLYLKAVEWTTTTEHDKLTVSIVQPNIPLEVKWNPFYRTAISNQLLELTEEHWQSDLIVWPEASIPLMYHDASDFIQDLNLRAADHNTALISGILYDDDKPNTFYNAIFGAGAANNIYFKQRLVPFGEYVPLEEYLRGLIAFFDLPNSIIQAGPPNQKGIQTDRYTIAPYICYEIVYPDLVANNLGGAPLMVTISNDAWFGESIGPLQHFQMAQMRALENGRYLIRGTNTGLSGIISPKGEAILTGTQFVAETLTGNVYLMRGQTLFSRLGSWPIVVFSLFVLLLCFLPRLRRFTAP